MGEVEKRGKQNQKILWGVITLAAVSFVVSVWWLFGFYIPKEYSPYNGSFGDQFGAVNALFSGLAFAGVVIAIFLQRQDLGKQEKMIDQANDEIEISKKTLKALEVQIEEQQKEMKRQRFEDAFFKLLEIQLDIIKDMDLSGDLGEARGRDCFRSFRRSFGAVYRATAVGQRVDYRHVFLQSYDAMYNQYKGELRHYYGNIETIFTFIDDNKAVVEAKKYFDIIINQQTLIERELLLYCVLASSSRNEFTVLARIYEEHDLKVSVDSESIEIDDEVLHAYGWFA